ncbi:MAG: homoserine O-acetyltransferase [Saprospiraceae bacterium]|jgi:homoserine O-acetyltransferase
MEILSEIKYCKFDKPLKLESGEILSRFRLAYQTFGTLNHDKSNVIWVVHALTANSDPFDWWPGVVGNDQVINPNEYFIICANALGSHYGSTNALDINPETGEKYYHDFPLLTNRDIVDGFIHLQKELKLPKIKLLIGASLGGQQAMEWAIKASGSIENLILIATNAKHSPYGIAFNESQRLAIQADRTWKDRKDDAGELGLIAARSIALLSYRTATGYDLTQQDTSEDLENFRATSYQRYQGEKLIKRFDAFSYWTLSKAMDSHNVGRGRGGLDQALSLIQSNTIVIGINSDVLFPTKEQKLLAQNISNARYEELTSKLGHDGFLTESVKVSGIIAKTLVNNPILRTIEKASL